ncbi:ribose 5-phosphate isomerase A [Paenibacillus phyllosphaerae]|uniref:Ribose-5-phosphate isomerase A n=1 Tax=Paenibacillus phyllosphaerae TaxID=274593 RepID=A0A7W5AZI3_9BACL|nr:ribose-5-phosphate isomerase RpiA [Paenibacillus phyllosphaerae]MBB3111136.1 ribose 5-phosphate isomerase A [Paenibacillus phyllosphaerae]
MQAKQVAAVRAVQSIQEGMVVGLGTGSTAYYAIQEIGRRTAEGLQIKAVATSVQSENLAKELGIPLIPFAEVEVIDVTIDGADEVDGSWNLIKGGGGALLREKIVAAASKQLIIIVDESKAVGQLGKFPLPVEIVTFASELTLRKLEALGCKPVIRLTASNEPFITDNGNYTVDCHFDRIEDADQLNLALHAIPGVVDHGLFLHMATQVIVGYADGSARELER